MNSGKTEGFVMNSRSTGGNETRIRLLHWSAGQTQAEGLAAQILKIENYEAVDPSHPLGGPDGLKDIICRRGNRRWIGAAYFPHEPRSFKETLKKFKDDFKGVQTNKVDGIAFITNQDISLADREKLIAVGNGGVDLFHLERIVAILNSPNCYGIRLEYLDIDMTKEEQLSYFAERDKITANLQLAIEQIRSRLEDPSTSRVVLSEELEKIRRLINPFFGDPISSLMKLDIFGRRAVDEVRDLIDGLRQLEQLLPGLNDGLRRFKVDLEDISGSQNSLSALAHTFSYGRSVSLRTAVSQLTDYEKALSRAINQQKELLRLRAEISRNADFENSKEVT